VAERLRDGWQMYRRLIGARMRAQLEYRASFALMTIGSFLLTAIDLVEVLVLFRHFHALRSWTLPEVMLLYGISGVGIALADMVIGHAEQLHLDIRSGQFDVVLLRPAGTLLQVAASDIALRKAGRLTQALIPLAYAIGAGAFVLTPDRVALLVVGILSAALVFAGVFVLGACLTFFTVGSGEVAAAFSYGGSYLSSYPLDIFGALLRRALSFAIPLAFVVYFPGLYLLDKQDPLGYPRWVEFIAPVVAVGFACVAGAVWRFSVRHYRSTGS
jgi:ABC-2 type transport system permease protein